MKQYTITANYNSLFGMDVHARSITIKGFERATGEVITKCFRDCPQAVDIALWMEKYFTAPYYAAYESGCTAFYLAKELRKLGIDCDIIAISSLARSRDDRQRKTDLHDAKRLLAEILMPIPTYTTVWIPDDECEADRDLVRARTDVVMNVKRAKQQLSALLLRHGHVWNKKTPMGRRKNTWTGEHWSWIDGIDLKEKSTEETRSLYKGMIKDGEARLKELNVLIEKRSKCARWKPYVDALALLKGIDTYSAFLLTVEFGDFARFDSGREVSKWLGTVSKESSSGEHVSHGHITKAGNSHCRCALAEGIAAIKRHTTSPKKPRSGARVSADMLALAAKAQRRLATRYYHLTVESKLHVNKARMAIVNEMIRWVWQIGLSVKAKQAA